MSDFMMGSDRDEQEKQLMAQIAEEFPDQDVVHVYGAPPFRAVPAGTPVVQSMSLNGLLEKLREQRDGSADAG